MAGAWLWLIGGVGIVQMAWTSLSPPDTKSYLVGPCGLPTSILFYLSWEYTRCNPRLVGCLEYHNITTGLAYLFMAQSTFGGNVGVDVWSCLEHDCDVSK